MVEPIKMPKNVVLRIIMKPHIPTITSLQISMNMVGVPLSISADFIKVRVSLPR